MDDAILYKFAVGVGANNWKTLRKTFEKFFKKGVDE